jgi:hypothetical protein
VRQSHLTYYFPTIHDLLQGVAKHTLDAMTAELSKRDAGQRPPSLVDAAVATSADKRRMRMVLGLVTTADREPKLKPRMREFLKEIRQGISQMLQAGGLEGTPDQVAFMHSVPSARAFCSSPVTTRRRARSAPDPADGSRVSYAGRADRLSHQLRADAAFSSEALWMDVLIVGAGPTGLMLANQLGRRGARHDHRPALGPAQQSRAMAVQARTLEIYSKMASSTRRCAGREAPVPNVGQRKVGGSASRSGRSARP